MFSNSKTRSHVIIISPKHEISGADFTMHLPPKSMTMWGSHKDFRNLLFFSERQKMHGSAAPSSPVYCTVYFCTSVSCGL